MAVEGPGIRRTDPRVALQVEVLLAANRRASPGEVVGIGCQPRPGLVAIREVELRGHNRILLTRASAKKVGVVSKQPDAGHELHDPLAIGTRQAKLRLEGPAVVPDVDQLCRIVLPERHHRGEADAHDAPAVIRPVLLRGHRRGPVQVHAEPHSRIGKSEAAGFRGLAQVQAFDVAGDDGQHNAHVGRSAGKTECPREGQRRRVDRRARLIDGCRRIKGQVAPIDAVDGGDDVQPPGDWPVGPRLEFLRRGGRRHEQQQKACGHVPKDDTDHFTSSKGACYQANPRVVCC